MPDEIRSPIKHHLVLHRIDPEQGIRRFYSLMIERDLFGTVRLVRNCRIGTNGQEMVEVFADGSRPAKTSRRSRTKRRRGYRDLRSGDKDLSRLRNRASPNRKASPRLLCHTRAARNAPRY